MDISEKAVTFFIDEEVFDKMRTALPHGTRKPILSSFCNKLVTYIESTPNPKQTAVLIANGTIGISFNDPR